MEERAKEDILINESLEVNSSQALGDGTEDNPFIISDADELSSIRNNLSAFYMLASDIDLKGGTIVPIGTLSVPFTGGFDGDGHAIKNFKISASSYAGLFGYAKSAKLKNLGMENGEVKLSLSSGNYAGTLAGVLFFCTTENIRLVNISVSGNQYTGSLAGYVYGGSLVGCSVSGNGSVSGTSDVGGLVGRVLDNTTEVKECCSEVSVTANAFLGGLVGVSQDADISDSYATGSVTSTTGNQYTGGLVGQTTLTPCIRNCYAACKVSQNGSGLVSGSPTVINSYFDSVVAEFGINNAYNVGKLTPVLIREEFFKDWDFENVWDITEGSTYPYLRSTGKPGAVVDVGAIAAGTGIEEDPYIISNELGLNYIKYDLSAFYRLSSDIDLNGGTIIPIGTPQLPFTGGFDGDGHAIKNFKISVGPYVGLFRYAKFAKFKNLGMESAEVKISTSSGNYAGTLAGVLYFCTTENIRLVNLTVSGNQYTGSLAGYVYGGSLVGCSVSGNGSVSGTSDVGGLVGRVLDNTTEVKECCSEVSVTANAFLGGLVGVSQDADISDSYAKGSVTSTTGNQYTGGLVGYTTSATSIRNCYAACKVSQNGSGLVSGSPTVINSYFDSVVAGITVTADQARTTDQMLSEETYIGWNWESIWKCKVDSYPILKNIEIINQEPFELTYRKLTYSSIIIEWPDIPGTSEYNISYLNKMENSLIPTVHIENLYPNTDYEFRVRAKIGDTIRVWSKTLRITTKKVLFIDGLHSVGKDLNSITLTWNQVEDAEGYEVIYNNSVQSTSINTCAITGLYTDMPYVIYVRALITDGSTATSNPIVEKIYYLDPQTDYAREFIGKCENQTWFVDEIENLLNLKGKSINTINSRMDFATIFALGLADRGVSGRIPAAIGELFQLAYLYLANNDLSGNLPAELELLDKLIEMDFSGNHLDD